MHASRDAPDLTMQVWIKDSSSVGYTRGRSTYVVSNAALGATPWVVDQIQASVPAKREQYAVNPDAVVAEAPRVEQ